MSLSNLSYLKSSYQHLTQPEILRSNVIVLIGINDPAVNVLRSLGIETVFDLALNTIFRNAQLIYLNAVGEDESLVRLGRVAPDMVNADIRNRTAEELVDLPISNLRGVSVQLAGIILGDLGIRTIRELGNWPPFLSARRILNDIHQDSPRGAVNENGTPLDLLPANGTHPTEIFYYKKLVMVPAIDDDTGEASNATHFDPIAAADELLPPNDRAEMINNLFQGNHQNGRTAYQLLDEFLSLLANDSEEAAIKYFTRKDFLQELYKLALEQPLPRVIINHFKQLWTKSKEKPQRENDLTNSTVKIDFEKETSGFKQVMFGAELVFSQSWTGEGVALGNLIESLTLAPGESRKIAEVSFKRSTSTRAIEAIAESDQIESELIENRAIAETVNATANEIQTGNSGAVSSSSATEFGAAAGGFISPVVAGAAFGTSSNQSVSNSFSVAVGNRNVTSETLQSIDQATSQNSSATRNRNAALNTSSSVSESESINTRVVTNYNHMHALTIQYYEVIQNFLVRTKSREIKRVIYVPFTPINFISNERAIQQFKGLLIRFARSNRLRRALILARDEIIMDITATLTFEELPNPEIFARPSFDKKRIAIEMARARARSQYSFVAGINLRVNNGFLNSFNQEKQINLPAETELVSISCLDEDVKSFVISLEDGNDLEINQNGESALNDYLTAQNLSNRIRIGDIRFISFRYQRGEEVSGKEYAIRMQLRNENISNTIEEISIPVSSPNKEANSDKTNNDGGRSDTITFLSFSNTRGFDELGKMLNQHRLFYSQVIWKFADPSWVLMQLGDYKVNGKQLTKYIDPNPIAIVGNTVAFYWSDDSYPHYLSTWVQSNTEKTEFSERIIALPSKGKFAEAVLGRSNSAEKLDLTRFWNWQDSPIPHTAPDIAPIQAGQRSGTDVPLPGNLSAPIINMMTPSAMPDPTGMQAGLQTISNGNMFRDMSGLAQTVQLAQAALNASSAGASNAANQAGANMATGAQAQLELVKAVASLAPMLFGLPPLPMPATSNITNSGAALNATNRLNGNPMSSTAASSSGDGGGQAIVSPGKAEVQRTLERLIGGTPTPNPAESIIRDILRVPNPSSPSNPAPIGSSGGQGNNTSSATPGQLEQRVRELSQELESVVLPTIASASGNFPALRNATRTAMDWIVQVQSIEVNRELQEGHQRLMQLLQGAYSRTLGDLRDSVVLGNNVSEIPTIFQLLADTQLLGIDNLANFSISNVLNDLRLSVVMETVSFDQNIAAGQTTELRIRARLRVGQNEPANMPISIGLEVEGCTVSPSLTGITNQFGMFTALITRVGDGDFSITARAIFDRIVETEASLEVV